MGEHVHDRDGTAGAGRGPETSQPSLPGVPDAPGVRQPGDGAAPGGTPGRSGPSRRSAVPAARSAPAEESAAADRVAPYYAAVTAAWRVAAERGLPALALVPMGPTAQEPQEPQEPHRHHGPRESRAPDEIPDPGGHLVRWANHALLELVGLDHTEVVGRPLSDLPSDSTSSWVAVTHKLLRGTSSDMAAVVRRPDEGRQQVSVDIYPLGHGIDGWLVTLHPATDEEQIARSALREAEDRFRALAEHAPTGIFVSEAGVRLGYLNHRFAELLGADPHHLLGTRWLEYLHPDDLPKLYDTLEWVLGGEPGEVTLRLRPSGSAQRWIFLRIAPTTTPSRAAGFIGTADDITTRRAWEERLSYQARHDALTGLLNQGRLTELLREALASRRGADREFAVALVDLDGFADVNDAFGRDAGDRVLVEVASRLRRVSRERDSLARLGGDEFVVLLGGVRTRQQAETAARRHLESLATPVRLGQDELRVSASVGVALPGPRDTPEIVLRSAELLLRQARQAGPGRVRIGTTADVVTLPGPSGQCEPGDGQPGDGQPGDGQPGAVRPAGGRDGSERGT
jgi:diguanylate cyclase (GGDEF)-like protein/PAS domain S-box-containing protein